MDFNTRAMRLNSIYRKAMNHLVSGLAILATIIVIAPLVAILFYLIHALGIVVFPLQMASSWTNALLYGALFGFFAYATYDLTNLATLRGWPVAITVVDLAWGTFATALAAVAAFLARRAFA